MSNAKYQQMEHEHLTLLTSRGMHYTSILLTTAKLLQSEYEKEIPFSEEKNELLTILIKAAGEHSELIEWSINERQNNVSSNEENIEP